jgi:alkylation response protein AidB-like acyl-CoA dehydrogenase
MDFSWSEEQQAMRATVIRFAQQHLNTDIVERDRTQSFSWENWRRCVELGLQGLPIPETYGGAGIDFLTTLFIMEGLGYGCRDNGLLFALSAQHWSVQSPILAFGTEEQKQCYLPRLCRGEIIGAHALSEPNAGSDAFSLCARAHPCEGGYTLEGSKIFVTNSCLADVFLVYATLNPDDGWGGISVFLVDRDTPGLTLGHSLDKMGLRTAPMGEVFLNCCRVPTERRLGAEGGAISIFNHVMERERVGILASYLGTMARQIEECVKYAKQRRQFGSPLGKFQLVASKIADMQVRLETARLILYKVGWLLNQNKGVQSEAAVAKLYLSEGLLQSSLDALQIYGGYGYMTEFQVEREVRDAIAARLYSGTSEMQRLIIARSLGL